jgi:hypothetical protein
MSGMSHTISSLMRQPSVADHTDAWLLHSWSDVAVRTTASCKPGGLLRDEGLMQGSFFG